ncbi:hypothetical protein TNCT_434791 [Trichonephila clavata]|uniref:Uncharacterized protein n=1 Tax=Trichonephila clavata TaxID=2740835 RepID=A0A8X6LHU2_TRICU|nr:hypothetical protein TNCT_434791 [Trichonephila clavata]
MSDNSQRTHDIVAIINRVVAAQRACTFQWIPVQIILDLTPCRNCPQTQLTTDHTFDCKAILASLFKLDASPQDILYSPQAPVLASLVIGAFDPI